MEAGFGYLAAGRQSLAVSASPLNHYLYAADDASREKRRWMTADITFQELSLTLTHTHTLATLLGPPSSLRFVSTRSCRSPTYCDSAAGH